MNNWNQAKKNGLHSFLGIGILSVLNSYFGTQAILLTGAFGATAVLLFAAEDSPLIQKKNMYFGHLISAFVGVTSFKLFYNLSPEFSVAFAVGAAIMLMTLLNIIHPPGGATAYIAVYGGFHITQLGYYYLFCPVLIGLIILDFSHYIQTKY